MTTANFKATRNLLEQAEAQIGNPRRLAIILDRLVDLMKRSEKDIAEGKFIASDRVKMAEDCKIILDFVELHR